MADNVVGKAGDIDLLEVVISPLSGPEADIRLYVGELNLFEDMYSPGLYGNLLVIDAANLNNILHLTGDEWITLKMKTPSMPDDVGLIYKTFKLYSITDRQMISDTGKQTYVLHFCSPELILDSMRPLFQPFEGKISDVVSKIFTENLSQNRTSDKDVTSLIILGPTSNNVKFVSPGWRPVQCINWLASKALGEGYRNPGYLFYESNKAFYFANIEALIDSSVQSKQVYQNYVFQAKQQSEDQSSEYNKTTDINADYAKVENMHVMQNMNSFRNLQNGYYANRLFTLDLHTKEYNKGKPEYDHVKNYDNYVHLENIAGNKDCAPFSSNVEYSYNASLNFYPKNRNLYTGFLDNVNDNIERILPQRLSTLTEISNFKIQITVPGRTDIEVGFIVRFSYPDTSPRDESDYATRKEDSLYTGYYLVTAIRHKITLQSHVMTLELSKDSLNRRPS